MNKIKSEEKIGTKKEENIALQTIVQSFSYKTHIGTCNVTKRNAKEMQTTMQRIIGEKYVRN